MVYQSVLLAADGSENSFRAAKELMNFIDKNTKVTILNVIDVEDSKDEVLHGMKSENIDSITKFYDENNVNYNVVKEHGVPEDIVLKYANSMDYNMITLGSRGLNSLQEIVIGSLSRKVAKKADIPVLIVK